MNKAVKSKWLRALRSKKYRKAKGQLRIGNSFCCLGVLCDISNNSGNWDIEDPNIFLYPAGDTVAQCDTRLPDRYQKAIHFKESDENELIRLNDSCDTWDEVISYIDKNM
jgi:hypothetical protein